jgi:hypothetical protein
LAPTITFVLGRFHLSFDPAAPSSSGPLTFDFISDGFFSPVSYSYLASSDLMSVGGLDFTLSIANFTTVAFQPADFVYDVGYGAFKAKSGLVHVAQFAATPVAATPIPAALPLFASALGAMGIAGWRQRKRS